MSDETATTEHPRAALPTRGTTALLYDTALVLVRTRTRRRIPFEAVERVDGPGADGRTLRIELTSPHGPGEALTLRGADPEALAAFTAALTSSLPPRAPHQARRDGRRLTSTERIAFAPARELQAAGGSPTIRTLVVLYLLALPVVVLATEDLGRSTAAFDALGDWLRAGLFLLPGAALARVTASTVRTACLLRLRGVTVTGRLTGVRRGAAGEPAVYHYTFTDRDGTDHPHETQGWPLSTDGRTTPIRYAPRTPERGYAPADRMGFPAHAALGAIGLVLLWLGLDSAVPTALEAVRVLREG
ncbi:hypothetical protein J7W19_10840 [Streptomyces mobaraensis NBRC 13819 = DSM 40847]|uniref:Uncharacterized protein n=1 Tax=Streptomyces mobaraensis (strain ATCC 29032 / DSM 40847 / JCM 4168 / NBRC 13819 / NCIMB 11159 / IPCR 16-22) TaxID=1223523 RepID=M3BZK6_STRM1|nr:hypothetical protein [Streptomyces mobaraensis]EME97195.1 hypothetical protein H340_27706 [Streptomyces mobaraensis NBRC 13819 = DSM 40847]QTT73851.1 hypothetical protein J7W19_10840 [Streptomyces mobaraensis NBRC 13819 = DSM 40847]